MRTDGPRAQDDRLVKIPKLRWQIPVDRLSICEQALTPDRVVRPTPYEVQLSVDDRREPTSFCRPWWRR